MTHSARWVALLGRRDLPTDALRDYCCWLKDAVAERGIRLELSEVTWRSAGSFRGFLRLWIEAASWRQHWVLLQYTALGWSLRGFPFRVLLALLILRIRGARCVVIFHDSEAYGGARRIDKFRRGIQHWVMKQIYRMAHRSIFTTPVQNIGWLPANAGKATFIAIGANIPKRPFREKRSDLQSKTVAVFGLTGGDALDREIRDICHAVLYASKNHPQLKLVVMGRNSREAEQSIRSALAGTAVQLEVLGLISPPEISNVLSMADVYLFVRGAISSSRSSALAGVAAGLPIVGYRGRQTSYPMTEAGLELVHSGDRQALGIALDGVLSDDEHRRALGKKSLLSYANHFSWQKIAQKFEEELGR
jgi:glycosyltransferase involved in cell wall biosynthesis